MSAIISAWHDAVPVVQNATSVDRIAALVGHNIAPGTHNASLVGHSTAPVNRHAATVCKTIFSALIPSLWAVQPAHVAHNATLVVCVVAAFSDVPYIHFGAVRFDN